MWITSMGNHGAAGGISECRGCSFYSFFLSVDSGNDLHPLGHQTFTWTSDDSYSPLDVHKLDDCALGDISVVLNYVQTHTKKRYLHPLLWICLQMNATTPHWHLVNIVAWGHQAITWTNVDHVLCCNMVPLGHNELTLEHLEMHGCVVSTVATDALVLKHQAISIHNADLTFIVLDQFHIKLLHIRWTASEKEITFKKKLTQSFKV